jgi:riboflavin transporter FmnP
MKLALSNLSIAITSIIVLSSIALTFQTEIVWMAQDFTAIPSLFFLLAIILLGARLSGRLKSIQGLRISNPLGVHKKFGVFFTILVIVTFVIGLWGQIFHGEPLFW